MCSNQKKTEEAGDIGVNASESLFVLKLLVQAMTPCKKMQLEEEPPSFRLLECQIRNTSYVTVTLCVECKKTFSKFYDLKKTKRKLLATYTIISKCLIIWL